VRIPSTPLSQLSVPPLLYVLPLSHPNPKSAVEFHPYFLSPDDLEELKETDDFERISKAAASFSSLHAHRLVAFAKQRANDRQSDVRHMIL